MESRIRLVPDGWRTDPLAELTARVERLEAAARAADPVADEIRSLPAKSADPTGQADPLWMLSGLAERYPTDAVVGYVGRIPAAERASDSPSDAGYRGPQPVSWQYGLGVEDLLGQDWDGERVASRLAALGNPTRLRLAQEILRGRDTVASLGELDGVGTAGQVYHHLSQLQSSGWVRQVSRGRYGVPPERVVPLLVIALATGGVS